MTKHVIFLAGAFALVMGCAREAEVNLQDASGEIQSLTFIAPEPIQFEAITGRATTKGTSVQDGSALLFNWAVGDTLGIFPNKGNQVEFPISEAQGSTSAFFDGGGWALRNNASYAAYYPFSVWNYHRDNETIVLDYSGQVQDGNGSFAHLSAYDYLASNKTTPQNSAVTFQMERQGSILYIDIVVPEPETITSLTISCDEPIFVEKAALNISGSEPVVTPLKTTESLTLSFKNTVTTSDNETVRAYMAVQPVDFTQKTVTATLATAIGGYTAPVTPRVVNKGRAAFLRFSDSFAPVNIEFEDAEVKRICVENWDTNGDGELSYKEAAAVESVTGIFNNNSTIRTLNDLKYFTGLRGIGFNSFEYCSNLVSITIPDQAFFYAWGHFEGCDNLAELNGRDASSDHRCLIDYYGTLYAFAPAGLTSYTIPAGVKRVMNHTFLYCTYLTSLTFPESVTEIDPEVFIGCYNLAEFNGKFASSDHRCLIVDGVLKAIAPAGATSITIPESVTEIETGFWGFGGCDKLAEFNGKFASADHRCLINNGNLMAFAPAGVTSYTIPEGVTRIGDNTFQYCSNLTSITIPESVTSIGYYAFENCTGLVSLTCLAHTPPSGSASMFSNTNNCPIYVPNESVAAYKTAAGWSSYASRIVGIDVEGTVVGPEPQNPD